MVSSVARGSVEGSGRRHSPSLREEMATEQCESTVISTPVTMTLGPPLTQSSITEMRESLPLSEVPSSLARYVTCEGDSSVQENDWLPIVSLLHSAQVGLSWSRTALVMFSGSS